MGWIEKIRKYKNKDKDSIVSESRTRWVNQLSWSGSNKVRVCMFIYIGVSIERIRCERHSAQGKQDEVEQNSLVGDYQFMPISSTSRQLGFEIKAFELENSMHGIDKHGILPVDRSHLANGCSPRHCHTEGFPQAAVSLSRLI